MQQSRFDRWSLLHAAAGALLTLAFWATGIGWFSLLITVTLELLWEYYENSSWAYGGTWLWRGCQCPGKCSEPFKFCETCGPTTFQLCIYPNYKGDEPRHTVWDIYITTAGGLLAAIFLSTIGFNTLAIGLVLGFSGILLIGFFSFFVFADLKQDHVLPISNPLYNVDGLTF